MEITAKFDNQKSIKYRGSSLVAPNFSFYNHLVLSKIFDVNAVTAIIVSDDNYYNFLTKEIIFFPKYGFCLKI